MDDKYDDEIYDDAAANDDTYEDTDYYANAAYDDEYDEEEPDETGTVYSLMLRDLSTQTILASLLPGPWNIPWNIPCDKVGLSYF
jgi:hypothetical protein